MFYILIIAMIFGWYEGNRTLFMVHNGLEKGITTQPKNLVEFLLNNE